MKKNSDLPSASFPNFVVALDASKGVHGKKATIRIGR
jgi:hypothetical protein